MLEIYIDADSCPVKDEVYRVAWRQGIVVHVVANQHVEMPPDERFRFVLVGDRFDEADDWIAERAGTGDVVVTADIPLAARCLENGCQVIGPRGRVFDEEHIGEALAAREAAQFLREMGVGGGPPPFSDKDRSRFAQKLDVIVAQLRKAHGG